MEREDLRAGVDRVEKQLVKLVRSAEDGIHIDQLSEKMALPYAQIAASMMVLEMTGFVKVQPGNMYRDLK